MKMTLKKLKASSPGVSQLINPQTLDVKYYPSLTWINANDVFLVEEDDDDPRERKTAAAALKAATRMRSAAIKGWKP